MPLTASKIIFDDLRELGLALRMTRDVAWDVGALDAGALRVKSSAGDVLFLEQHVWLEPVRLEPFLAEARRQCARLICVASETPIIPSSQTSRYFDYLPFPTSLSHAVTTLGRAFEALHQGRIVHTAKLLSSERNVDRLLATILEASRAITGADAGSLYVVENGSDGKKLRFKIAQNESRELDLEETVLDVDPRSIAGRCVVAGQINNIPDVRSPSAPVLFDDSIDVRLDYVTRSVLAVPLKSSRGDVIGVVQLINRKRGPGFVLDTAADFAERVVPFDSENEAHASALAGQAGISLENALLYHEIKAIFEGFVRASVQAIESRDPTTSGHSVRVAELTCALARVADRQDEGSYADLRVDPQEMQRIEWAALLHDFGKVTVPEHVLIKAKKLYDAELVIVRQRFELARQSLEIRSLRGELSKQNVERLRGELETDLQAVLTANEPRVLAEELSDRLGSVAQRTYIAPSGEERPLLLPHEVAALKVRRGSLTAAERRVIEGHVVHTQAFLEKIPWGRELRGIAELAGAHHEKLDGSGYPHGVKAEQITPAVRMMTICDIFDALVAWDRPYKKAVPVVRALDILQSEVKSGKLDEELFRLFVDGDVYRLTTEGAPA